MGASVIRIDTGLPPSRPVDRDRNGLVEQVL